MVNQTGKTARGATSRSRAERNDVKAPQAQAPAGRGAKFVDPQRRRMMIAEAAYYISEQRAFEPGRELEDWCQAEAEIDRMLLQHQGSTISG